MFFLITIYDLEVNSEEEYESCVLCPSDLKHVCVCTRAERQIFNSARSTRINRAAGPAWGVAHRLKIEYGI